MHIATKSSKIDISLESNTSLVSKKIINFLKKGDIIFLYGDLGVGKTTFIKYLINNFQSKYNVAQTEVPSPTFNLVHEYKVGELLIMHYDLYRLKNYNDVKNIGLFENYKDAITFIEWPEVINPKPKDRIELFFRYENNLNNRSLIIFSNYKKEIIDEFK
tara:strand:- start:51 stop:530 length:480 start_codon:yes stop_codon:yes gene_type:complete